MHQDLCHFLKTLADRYKRDSKNSNERGDDGELGNEGFIENLKQFQQRTCLKNYWNTSKANLFFG